MVTVGRATTEADWDAASVLLDGYVGWIRCRAGFDPLAEQPSLGAELSSLAAHYSVPGRDLFLAWLDRTAVGTVAITLDGNGGAELKRMYVLPAARGRGVADALIAAALAAAASCGCRSIWLESVAGAMDPAIAVYRRNGFTVAEYRPATLTFERVVVMERRLEPA